MKIESINSWDQAFFENFLTFRNKIHSNIETSFPETIDDYARYFTPSSAFEHDFLWQALIVKNEGLVVAKAILCWRKGSSQGNLGFLDWENNISSSQLLIDQVITCAKLNGLNKLKTPVDLNFFLKYRIRLPGGGEPFWGEPIYPDYYHELFQKTGFAEIARWDTYRIKVIHAISDYFMKRKKLSITPKSSGPRPTVTYQKITIRSVDMGKWDQELKIFYELFHEAYKSMPEWESLSFEQFKVIYDDFKYIIHPWYSYIALYKGCPVGFSINFADPLPILKKIKGKKLSRLDKAWLFIKLRMNLSCFIIAHVGKIPGPNGEEVKGVQIKFSQRIQFFSILMRKVLVSFQVTDSPSRRSFDTSYQDPYAQYVLYGKDL